MERVSRRLERGKGRGKKFRSDVKVLAEGMGLWIKKCRE
jgi:hypothetical protein